MKPVSARVVLAMLLPMAAVFGQLQVHKEVPPPFTLSVEDLCAVTITSPEPLTVWVRGEAAEETHGPIGRVTTNSFELQPGINSFDAGHIPPIEDKWFLPEYEPLIMQTGLFPEGDYWLKVYVYSMGPEPQLLGSDSVPHQVRYPQLELVSPPDASEVDAPDQFFNWAISLPVPGLGYEFSVYEIMAGQTKYDAVNNIPHFRQDGFSTPSHQYSPGAKPFEQGHFYCWQVRALVQPSYLLATSDVWGFVFGAVAQAESCTYYLGDEGKMWHSLGTSGTQEVASESCHYLHSKQQKKMYHATGTGWTPVTTEPRCTWIMADNGMYHSLGRGQWEGPKTFYKCNHILAKNGMWHSTGTGWESVKPESCTYTFSSPMGGKLFHANGTGWDPVTRPRCTYILAGNDMVHSNGTKWTPVRVKKCNYILTEHGMRHFDGTNWVVVKPESCKYYYAARQKKMYHGNGTAFTEVTYPVCYWIKAENGMYHFTGKGWRGPARGKRVCYCLLAVNGLFHWKGGSWVLVNPAFCTYAYDNEHGQMLHGTGKGWEAVPNPDPCNYVKAHNGMFHYKGKKQGWVLERTKKCKYFYSNMQKKMWHSTKTDWEEVEGEDGKVIPARNGTYRYDKDKGWVKQP
jgi:hypothetical protein